MSEKKKPKPTKKKLTPARASLDDYGLNPQQRRFADLYLRPMPAVKAYKEAGYSAVTYDAQRSAASEILTNHNVKAYIQAERQRLAEENHIEKSDAVAYLARLLRAAPNDVDGDSDLAQEMTEDEMGGELLRRRVKLPSKIEAVKQLSQMLGWNEPEKVKHEFEVVIGGNAQD